MMYPLVTDLAAEGVPVAVTCRVLGFSKQGYYRWRSNPVTERDCVDAHLVNAALDIHADDPAFGYRFIADELEEKGITASENRVLPGVSPKQRRLYQVQREDTTVETPDLPSIPDWPERYEGASDSEIESSATALLVAHQAIADDSMKIMMPTVPSGRRVVLRTPTCARSAPW